MSKKQIKKYLKVLRKLEKVQSRIETHSCLFDMYYPYDVTSKIKKAIKNLKWYLGVAW